MGERIDEKYLCTIRVSEWVKSNSGWPWCFDDAANNSTLFVFVPPDLRPTRKNK